MYNSRSLLFYEKKEDLIKNGPARLIYIWKNGGYGEALEASKLPIKDAEVQDLNKNTIDID